jgi:sigma-B regulation protein RsbU (phosphoserine phosphatase)
MPSTFEFTAPALAAPSAARGATGRILVVDDTEANRDMLARRLRRDGHDVEMADSGAAALASARARPFDVVLLDIMMPEMNGYEVLEALKRDDALRHIPVIMISAVDEMESVVRCIELGAEDHLPKPFNPTLLKARLGASLARKRLHDGEQTYARSLERELEIGRNIQQSFLPEQIPIVAGWELAVCFRPARQVAGDFYDVFTLANGERLAIAMADVCGKGVGAAVFMAAFRSVIRALTEQASQGGREDDAALLGRVVAFVNDYVATTHSRANMFTTLCLALLDPLSGVVTYVNAGHDPPIVRRRDGRVERLAPTGPAVGLLPGMDFRVERIVLDRGDTLLAFTDGVADARDVNGASYGEERLLAHAGRSHATAAALVAGLETSVVTHVGDTEQFDDITVLALRRDDEPGASR